MRLNKKISDGEHKEFYKDKSLKAVYNVKNGKIDGEYVEYYQGSDQAKIIAQYKDGVLNGVREEYSSSGRLIYKDNYENGHLQGVSEEFAIYKKTKIYDNGVLQSVNVNGGALVDYVSDETYQDGVLKHKVVREHGEVVADLEYRDGQPYDGFFSEIKVVNSNHDTCEVSFTISEGKYQGTYVNDYEGIVAHYEDGVLNGDYSEVNEESCKKGKYDHGKFNGTVSFDYGLKVEEYTADELDCVKTYRIEGWDNKKVLASEIRDNGACKEIDKKGNVKKYEQKNGVRDGVYEEFDAQGRIKESGTYKNGKLNGVYREFNSDGTVAARRFYKDGEDITPQQEVLRAAAAKNVNKENSEGKVNPKQSKIKKAQVALEMKMAGVKNKLMG